MRSIAVASLLAVALVPSSAHARSQDTLTVVTFNIFHDQREWPKRLAVILDGLRAIRPDVICLQEVLQHETLPNQAQTIADSLGYAMAHFTSTDKAGQVKRYGNAVLTRHPVLARGERLLEPLDDYRTAAHVRIDFQGRPIDVYDTHLHHTPGGGAIRFMQITDLVAFIDSTRGDGPVVVAGDFNSEPDKPELEAMRKRFTNVFRATHPTAGRAESITFNPRFGVDPGPIDHIYVSRTGKGRLVPVASAVIFREMTPDSVWASDHFGVMARIGVPK